MNWTLLKYFIKKNWALWLGFLAFLMMEMIVCILMVDTIPEMMDGMLGIESGASMLDFVANLLPIYCSMFVMAYCIFIIFRTLYKPIDSTSLSSHLAAGTSRKKYIVTAAVFLAASVFAMFVVMFALCGVIMVVTKGSIDWLAWLNLNFSFFVNIIMVAFICFFFASCFAPGNIAKIGMVGLPILFLLFQLFASFDIAIFKIISPFSWLDATAIAAGTFTLWWLWNLIFIAISVAVFTATLYIFKRKQLSI